MRLALGDIHGRFDPLFKKLRELDLKNCTIIQVGDFGAGFERPAKELARFKYLNNVLKQKNIKMYVMRGNHDDPKYFLGDYKYSNLELMPDNSIINIEGKNILLLGGAISIDRIIRKLNYDYWQDEKYVLNKELLSTFENINIVCSHPSPKMAFPYWNMTVTIRDNSRLDPTLVHELSLERVDLQEAYEILIQKNNIETWIHGHYHMPNKSEHEKTTFISLGIDELYEIK